MGEGKVAHLCTAVWSAGHTTVVAYRWAKIEHVRTQIVISLASGLLAMLVAAAAATSHLLGSNG